MSNVIVQLSREVVVHTDPQIHTLVVNQGPPGPPGTPIPPGHSSQILRGDLNWHYEESNAIYAYSNSVLTSISYDTGETKLFEYANNRITKITLSNSYEKHFEYTNTGEIASIWLTRL